MKFKCRIKDAINRSNNDRDPKYTTADFSRFIGVHPAAIRRRMEKTCNPPKPEFTSKNKVYYSLKDLLEWHKNYTNKDTENSNA